MRLALLIAVVALSACSGNRDARQPATPRGNVGRTNAVTVTPALGVTQGKVAHVNAGARFVVLTFPIGKLPPVDKRLSVYRDGMKVGELKVTGPPLNQNTVADITAGEAKAGDDVRDQ